MKKLCLLIFALTILNIFILFTNSSFASPNENQIRLITENDKKINYDLEYLQKVLNQDKKTFNISKKYINKLQTNTVKSFAEGVMDKKAKQINELEIFITKHRSEFE